MIDRQSGLSYFITAHGLMGRRHVMVQSSAGQDVGSTVKDLTHKRKAVCVDSLKKAAHRERNCRTNGERQEEDTRGGLLHW